MQAKGCNSYTSEYYSYNNQYGEQERKTQNNYNNLCDNELCTFAEECLSGRCYLSTCDHSSDVSLTTIIWPLSTVIVLVIIISCVCRKYRLRSLNQQLRIQEPEIIIMPFAQPALPASVASTAYKNSSSLLVGNHHKNHQLVYEAPPLV